MTSVPSGGSPRKPPGAGTPERLPPLGTEPPPTHGKGTWRSLVISMLVILGVVLLWQALTPTVSRVERTAVDVAASARAVHDATSWPILVADPGPQWRATSVRFDDRAGVRTWEVGYTRPDDESVFVSVAQTHAFGSSAPSEEWVREFTRRGNAAGTVDIDGRAWSAYTAQENNPRHSLVPPAGATPVSVVVSGLGDPHNLATVARTLRPYPPPAD